MVLPVFAVPCHFCTGFLLKIFSGWTLERQLDRERQKQIHDKIREVRRRLNSFLLPYPILLHVHACLSLFFSEIWSKTALDVCQQPAFLSCKVWKSCNLSFHDWIIGIMKTSHFSLISKTNISRNHPTIPAFMQWKNPLSPRLYPVKTVQNNFGQV